MLDSFYVDSDLAPLLREAKKPDSGTVFGSPSTSPGEILGPSSTRQLASQKPVSTHSCNVLSMHPCISSYSSISWPYIVQSQWTSYHAVKETSQRPLTGVDFQDPYKGSHSGHLPHLYCSHLHPHEQNMPSGLAISSLEQASLLYLGQEKQAVI